MRGFGAMRPPVAPSLPPSSPPLAPTSFGHGGTPQRQSLRPTSVAEDVRILADDLPLPTFSMSPRRTVSPGKANGRTRPVTELSGAIFVDASLQLPHPTFAASHTAASAPSPSAAGALIALPPSSVFENPDSWRRECAALRARLLRPADTVAIYHDFSAPLNSRATLRHACVVRPLPSLDKVQDALRRRFLARAPTSTYDVCEQQYASDGSGAAAAAAEWCDDTASLAEQEARDGVRGAHREQCGETFVPSPTTWCVGGSSYDNEVVIYDAATGHRLFRVLDPKMRVAVTALQHAPFRGFVEAQHLKVLPVRGPQDVLRLKASQLLMTDYVWCGLQDGSVRLLPANHHHIRAAGPSPSFSKAPSAELVFELPRHQGGAIISIVCSPCHDAVCAPCDEDDGRTAAPTWGMPNRVSDAIRAMTAASASVGGDPSSRQHLALACTAATDASVVVWDVRQVYEAVAVAQQRHAQQAHNAASATPCRGPSAHRSSVATGPVSLGGRVASSAAASTSSSAPAGLGNDVITFDCCSSMPGLQNMQVRSSCVVIQVRPVAKLSGGFAGLTALRWVSSLVVAGGANSAAARDARLTSRDARTAPRAMDGVPARELTQGQTRFDQREAQRAELELTEGEMQGVERELEHMLPPLAQEPTQSLRVNLLVAADCMGVLHVWNLDEVLHRYSDAAVAPTGWPASFGASYYSSLPPTPSRGDGRSARGGDGSLPEQEDATPLASCKTGRRTAAASKAGCGSDTRRTERDAKSRRGFRGVGLAEARENRGRLSELSANTATTGAARKSEGDSGAVAAAGRKSHQRPSAGRTSAEDRDAAEAEGGRLSGGHGAASGVTPPRRSHIAPALSPAAQHRHTAAHDAATSPAHHPHTTGRSGAAPAGAGKVRRPAKLRTPLQEASVSMSRSPLQSTSPSRGSAQRPSTSPSRVVEGHRSVQLQTSLRPRASVQRGTSVSLSGSVAPGGASADAGLPTQGAKCQIHVSEGVAAITEMVVELPGRICTTLRRISRPSRRVASWDHRPSEAEMDARVLENQFEELTEEKALFFAFQQLQVYVGVDGVVSLVRCTPQWLLPDDDERDLFRQRAETDGELARGGLTDAVARCGGGFAEPVAEVALSQRVSMGAFDLHLRRRLLDTHVQPVSELFLDAWKGRLWIARTDGAASVFATHDKSIVARLSHPSADALLAPVSGQEWSRPQEFGVTRGRGEEARGLPPSHLTGLLPLLARRPQRALLLSCSVTAPADGVQSSGHGGVIAAASSPRRSCHRTLSLVEPAVATTGRDGRLCAAPATRTLSHSGSDLGLSRADSSASSSPPRHGDVALVFVDGRPDVKAAARSREAQLWRWMRQLQLCRTEAATVCQAQRRRYYAMCDNVGRSVAHVIRELGDYGALSQLRQYFQLWRDHNTLYHRTHQMRRQRAARLTAERVLASRLEATHAARLRGAYYVRWWHFLAERRRLRGEEGLTRFALCGAVGGVRNHGGARGARQLARGRAPLPTAAMMERLHRVSALRGYWTAWRAWAAAQHRRHRDHHGGDPLHGSAARVRLTFESQLSGTPSLGAAAASPGPAGTPPRRLRPDRGAATSDFAAEDVVTPCRPTPTSSGAAWSSTQSSASPLGSLAHWGRPTARAALPSSPPPALEPLLAELLRARVYVFQFSDARSSATSVLDESWTVIVENAESGAEGDTDDDRRFSVFRFALLPLLQGLLSTADDVLPNLFNESVAEEVVSMLVGIVLAMDYVTTNAECVWWMLPEAAALSYGLAAFEAPEGPCGTFDAALLVLRAYAARAFATDAEAADVLRGLVKSRKVLAQFLDFAMERAVARRVEGVL